MRYGKVEYDNWLLEFRFNWKESKYDVFATHKEEQLQSEAAATGKRIGLVWKNPRKSRKKPCWEAYVLAQDSIELFAEFSQMREAGVALLHRHLGSN